MDMRGAEMAKMVAAYGRAVDFGAGVPSALWTPDAGRVIGPRTGGGFYACVTGLSVLEGTEDNVERMMQVARQAAVVPVMGALGVEFMALTLPGDEDGERIAHVMDEACRGLEYDGTEQGMDLSVVPRNLRMEPVWTGKHRQMACANALRMGDWAEAWKLAEGANTPVPKALSAVGPQAVTKNFRGQVEFHDFHHAQVLDLMPKLKAQLAQAAEDGEVHPDALALAA